jgi:GNAT superfamily N-acetyltransferase
MHYPRKLWVSQFWGSYLALAKKLLGFATRAVQGTHAYRTLVGGLNPGFFISAAGPNDLAEVYGEDTTPDLETTTTLFIARHRHFIIGQVSLVRHPQESYPYVGHWFYALRVFPLWRRMGVGEALVQIVIDRAKAEKAPELFCLVFDDNSPALNLYGKLGFQRVVLPAFEELLKEEMQVLGRRRVLLRKALA